MSANKHDLRCGCSIGWDQTGVIAFHVDPGCPREPGLRGTYRDFKAMVSAFCRAHRGRVHRGRWVPTK
jgi:hypothetical protein